MNEERTAQIHPVDEMLPTGQLFAYGLQHVLAMYAGAVAVPIIVAQALHLSPMELVHLIIAGLFTFLIAPFFSRFIRFFPPVVTGTIITIIGITLLPVAVNWMGGGNPKAPDFASPMNLFLAFITLVIIIAIYRGGKGFLSNVSVLLGLIGGTIIAMALGQTDFSEVGNASWFGLVTPFSFGLPTFDIGSILSMMVVMIVTMVETTGDCIAIGSIVGTPMPLPASRVASSSRHRASFSLP